MPTFRFRSSNFQEMNLIMRMMHFQGLADQIIDSFDYNDIKRGIKYAKDTVVKKETQNTEEKLEIIDDLFKTLIGWLKKEGRKV